MMNDVINWTASGETGLVGNAVERGTYAGGAERPRPTGTSSTYTTRPHDPQSRRTAEIQASFSSAGVPAFTAASPLTGSNSQKTHERQRRGRSGRLSSVSGTRRRPMKADPGFLRPPRRGARSERSVP